jgi:hypothetical protein
MASTLKATFTLEGAPQKNVYESAYVQVHPNAPPLKTKAIQTNDKDGNTLSLEFIEGFGDGEHVLADSNARVVYQDQLSYTSKELSGLIKIELLGGTYAGNVKVILTDKFGRDYAVEIEFDIQVVPQK